MAQTLLLETHLRVCQRFLQGTEATANVNFAVHHTHKQAASVFSTSRNTFSESSAKSLVPRRQEWHHIAV